MMATNVATGLEIEGEDHIRPVTWEEWIMLPVPPQRLAWLRYKMVTGLSSPSFDQQQPRRAFDIVARCISSGKHEREYRISICGTVQQLGRRRTTRGADGRRIPTGSTVVISDEELSTALNLMKETEGCVPPEEVDRAVGLSIDPGSERE